MARQQEVSLDPTPVERPDVVARTTSRFSLTVDTQALLLAAILALAVLSRVLPAVPW